MQKLGFETVGCAVAAGAMAIAVAAPSSARADVIHMPGMSAQQETRVTSSGLIVGGVILTVVGLAGDVLGVVSLVLECSQTTCGSNQVIGGLSLGLGLTADVTGVVMIAVGATPRPVVSENEDGAPRRAAITPDVFRVRTHGLGIRLEF